MLLVNWNIKVISNDVSQLVEEDRATMNSKKSEKQKGIRCDIIAHAKRRYHNCRKD